MGVANVFSIPPVALSDPSVFPNSLVLTLPATPSCVSVSPSGRLAVVGTTEGTLHLMEVETGQVRNNLVCAACHCLSGTTGSEWTLMVSWSNP